MSVQKCLSSWERLGILDKGNGLANTPSYVNAQFNMSNEMKNGLKGYDLEQ